MGKKYGDATQAPNLFRFLVAMQFLDKERKIEQPFVGGLH
jgi:hypothetical protein